MLLLLAKETYVEYIKEGVLAVCIANSIRGSDIVSERMPT
jgi:hypothetical protein